MKIGINTLFLVPGDVGGTEVYLRENLKEMVPANDDDRFILFTSRDNDESFRQDLKGNRNVSFVQLPFRSKIRPIRIIAEQILLPRQVKKHGIEVLWSPGYTAPLRCSCPQAVTIHDLQYKTHPEDLSILERATLDFLVKHACRVCESIIAVSEFSKQEIVRFNFAKAHKISVVYEGVDSRFGESSTQDISKLIGMEPGCPFILCVAHTYPHKQVHLLAEAFGKIMDEIPHHLVLIGKPRRGEPKLQECLEEMIDTSRIHRVSDLQYSELQAMYQTADLFVLPSQYEGFGLPILEAMLAGVSVITTDKASLPEVGGDHVEYVREGKPDNFAKAIMDILITDKKERSIRVEKGREWAKSFSWHKSAIKTLNTLKRLACENPPNQ